MHEMHFLKVLVAVGSKGLSLKILANELNISQKALNEKLQGRQQYTLEEMLKMSDLLGVGVEIFFN